LRVNRLKKFETVAAPGIIADTPEELAALIAELLLIAERMPLEKIGSENVTKNNSGDAEKINFASPTKKYTEVELKLLREIENGEQ
jgi:hypothetical protein